MEALAPIPEPQAQAEGKAAPDNEHAAYYIPATPIGELVPPLYPPAALAEHCGDCAIFVTLAIDAEGQVAEVSPSWQRLNVPVRHSDEFMDAIKAQVRTWRFEPARIVYWQRQADGEMKYLYAEKVPSRADLKFTFHEGNAGG